MVDAVMETERLVLRKWRAKDREPFACMNADAEVMRYFPRPVSRAESDAFVDRIDAHLGMHGFGLFALERKEDGAFLGFTGLHHGPAGTPVEDDIEIGWRLARAYWRQGYAHEAASACIDWFWRETAHPRLVSFTTVSNTPSQNLMRKLGFEHRPEMAFDHPAIARDHPLSPHRVFVLERGSRSDG